jgi:hypothetical protein
VILDVASVMMQLFLSFLFTVSYKDFANYQFSRPLNATYFTFHECRGAGILTAVRIHETPLINAAITGHMNLAIRGDTGTSPGAAIRFLQTEI